MTTFGITTPRARKTHVCDLCSRRIDPGETYKVHRYVDDYSGAPRSAKECAHCVALVALHLDDFAPYWKDEGYGLDDVREWRPNTDAARALREQFRQQWRTESGELLPVPVTEALGGGSRD